jgi:hypothetical protein
MSDASSPSSSVGPLTEERTSPYWVAKLSGAVEPRYRLYVQSFQEWTHVLLSLNVFTGHDVEGVRETHYVRLLLF